MTKAEIAQAIDKAEQGTYEAEEGFDLYQIAEQIHAAHDNKGRAYLKLDHVARLLAYQARTLAGTWDATELNFTINWIKRVVIITDY